MSDTTEKKDANRHHIAVRLDPETLARIDALRSRMSRWRDATTSEVLRAVILAGLEVEERELPPAGKGDGAAS